MPSEASETFVSWADFLTMPEIDEAANVFMVFPDDYETIEVEVGKTFYLGRRLSKSKRKEYMALLQEYANVFARSPSDLIGVPLELEEHYIDLVEGATPVWQ